MMASNTSNAAEELESLKATVQTTLDLITQLSTTTARSVRVNNTDVNALDLAHDTAKLIRAHSTKLSLLIINKPFTATAITTVLRELVAGPLPGLASAVEICDASTYTKSMSAEVQWHARKVFRELAVLVKAIPLDGNILSDDAKNGTGSTEGKGSLASTGVVWQACDGVVQLKAMGVAGLLVKMAEDHRELIEDALWELQEWGEGGSDADEDEDEDDLAATSDGKDPAQASLDNMFEPQRHIPTADPDKIRPRFDSSVKRLRLVMLLYQAVVKRRFKRLPRLPRLSTQAIAETQRAADAAIIIAVDEVMEKLKAVPEFVDELATAFYQLDIALIDRRMEECFSTSMRAAEILRKNWEQNDDEFSKWVDKLKPLLSEESDTSASK